MRRSRCSLDLSVSSFSTLSLGSLASIAPPLHRVDPLLGPHYQHYQAVVASALCPAARTVLSRTHIRTVESPLDRLSCSPAVVADCIDDGFAELCDESRHHVRRPSRFNLLGLLADGYDLLLQVLRVLQPPHDAIERRGNHGGLDVTSLRADVERWHRLIVPKGVPTTGQIGSDQLLILVYVAFPAARDPKFARRLRLIDDALQTRCTVSYRLVGLQCLQRCERRRCVFHGDVGVDRVFHADVHGVSSIVSDVYNDRLDNDVVMTVLDIAARGPLLHAART